MFFPTLYSYVWILICITDTSSQEMYHLHNKVVLRPYILNFILDNK